VWVGDCKRFGRSSSSIQIQCRTLERSLRHERDNDIRRANEWALGLRFLIAAIVLEIPSVGSVGWLVGNSVTLIDRFLGQCCLSAARNKGCILGPAADVVAVGQACSLCGRLRKELCKRLLSGAGHDPFAFARKRAAAAISSGKDANAAEG